MHSVVSAPARKAQDASPQPRRRTPFDLPAAVETIAAGVSDQRQFNERLTRWFEFENEARAWGCRVALIPIRRRGRKQRQRQSDEVMLVVTLSVMEARPRASLKAVAAIVAEKLDETPETIEKRLRAAWGRMTWAEFRRAVGVAPRRLIVPEP